MQDPLAKDVKLANGSSIQVYHASDNTRSFQSVDEGLVNQMESGRLPVKGMYLGKVQKLGLFMDRRFQDYSAQKAWEPRDGQAVYRWTGETLRMAYLRTIVADFGPNGDKKGNGRRSRGYVMDWEQSSMSTAFSAMRNATWFRRFVLHRHRLNGPGSNGG